MFAFLTGIIAYEHGPFTASLLLLALATLYPLAKEFPETFRLHWPWILGLMAYGGSSIALGLLHGTPIDELGKPLRFLLGVLVFLHLARTGFSPAAFWWGVGLGAAVAGVLAINEVVTEGAKRATLGFNPVPLGLLLSTLGTLALYRAATHPRLPGVMAFFVFSGLAFSGTVASGTRGAWLIWVVGATLIALFWLRRSTIRTSLKWIPLVILLLGATGIIWSTGHDRIDHSLDEIRLIQAGELHSSLGTRIQMWHTGTELGVRNPLTGLGSDRTDIYNAAKAILDAHGYEPRIITEFTHFHNQYIESFATFGLPGLLAWLALLTALVYKTAPPTREPAILVFSAFAIGALFESTMEAGRLIFMMILVGSMVRLLHDPFREQRATHSNGRLNSAA
ncbi:O-antigen ligase [Thioalkalivibrio sp. AKL7]|uniref:O-antigen ligase family protein n=1 Tax=Thioalkalivibrio sp. AKL7 TaxID=1158155 RepID=UPI001E2E0C29|nr:O-antigen ligase family protein [Thioalkalivibrio sp. AKL7]